MVRYVDPTPTIDEQLARKMLVYIDQNGPVKPWTLVAEVCEHDHDNQHAMDTLRPLILKGVLTPNADGDIRIYNRDRLEDLID